MDTLILCLLVYIFCVALLSVILNTYTLMSDRPRKLALRLSRACNAGVIVGGIVLFIAAIYALVN